MNTKANIWKLYAIRFFSGLIPAYVIERLYWEQRGMTIELVVYTEIIFALVIVLLEVPTGIIADRWGRRKLLVLSAALGCCEFLLLLFATEFWHFALVVALAGVATSAASGSENAMLYDSLLPIGQAGLFERYVGRIHALDAVAALLAALCGSLLAGRFGFELNYWLSVGSAAIAFALTLLLVEPAVKSGNDDGPTIPIKEYVFGSLRFFRNNAGVCLVLVSGMVAGAAVDYIDEFWQLYLDREGVPVAFFGLYSAAIFLLRIPGGVLAHALKKRFGTRCLLPIILAGMALGFWCAAAAGGYAGMAAILLVILFSGLIEPLAAGYLHHRIGSSMRATIDSFASLGESALAIAAGLGFGYFASKWDIFGGYGFLAALCGAFLLFFLFASRRRVEA